MMLFQSAPPRVVVLFVVGAWKPARQWITGALEARAIPIRDELDGARRLREEAQQLLETNRWREGEAAAEAEAILAHARAEAERIAAQAAHDLEQTLGRRQRLGEEPIAQEQAKALAEIRAIAVDIAISTAPQVITAELDQTRAATLIDAAI
jgi:F-type H+-transporting ATPase subunit b